MGHGHGADFPLTLSERSSRIVSLQITFTTEGLSHIEALHMGDTDFYAVLRDVVVVAQGVEVKLVDEINVGPAEIPTW